MAETELTEAQKTEAEELAELEAAIRPFRKTPEEVAQMAEGVQPYDHDACRRQSRPATPEELTGWEEFLQERRAERETERAVPNVA